MTIDSLDCIGDVAEDFEDNLLKNFLDIPLWNGREVEYLTKILEREFLIAFIHSFSNRLEINKPDSFLEANIENLYPNNLKNWEFDKEAPQNFCSERVTIAEGQGASENENSEAKPTQSKTNSSSCLGITTRFIFDLSVPRNVDPNVSMHPEISLLNMEELSALIEMRQRKNLLEINQAETIILKNVQRYLILFQQKEKRVFACA